MSDMHQPTLAEIGEAERLISLLKIDQERWLMSGDEARFKSAVRAASELEGWLSVATERGEVRTSLTRRIEDARVHYGRATNGALPWYLQEVTV